MKGTTMRYDEAKAIRKTIVDGLCPQWRKVKRNPWDMAANAIPDAPGAQLYWKARNASKGVMQHLANEQEDFNASHVGLGYEVNMQDRYELDEEQSRVMMCALANYRRAIDLATHC